jgi:hypothetical protein
MLTLLLVLLILGGAGQALAGDRLDAGTIKAGLRTAAPEEDGFVQRVVDMESAGQLPPGMVESTFLWARKKPRHRFQYFKQAIIVRAAEVGVQISG